VAEKLSADFGVLELLQTADSIDGLVAELKSQIEADAAVPVALVGHSWGAWLACICAARNPVLVKKLVLISCAPFEAGSAVEIDKTRLSRLDDEEKTEMERLWENMGTPQGNSTGKVKRFLDLLTKVDSYDALPNDLAVDFRFDIFQKVWPEAAALRQSGELLDIVKRIECPVVAIHGDHDPHPAEGVRAPLSRLIKDFRFILLEHCGHRPWIEREARDEFYRLLKKELEV